MRKLCLLAALLGALVTFGCSGALPAVWAQEPSEPQDAEVNFNIEGPELDVEVQRREAETAGAAAGVVGIVTLVISLALAVVMIAAKWKVFTKAGKPGWAVIVPIYNLVVLLQICGRPIWWVLLLLIPCVNIIVVVIVLIDLAKSFGKDALFGIGLCLLSFVFLPILGFGGAQYRGPAAAR